MTGEREPGVVTPPADGPAPPAAPGPVARRPSGRRRALRAALLVVAAALAVLALRGQWAEVGASAAALSPPGLVAALALALASLGASALAFRAALAALGSPLPRRRAARIYLVGQLGKYLPGSVWPVLAQMELGSEAGVPRARAAGAAFLALAAGVTGAVPLALLAAPALVARLGPDGPSPALLVAVAVLPLAALGLLHPRVLRALLAPLARLARRPLPPWRLTTGGVARVTALTTTAVATAGLSVAVLAVDVGATGWLVVPLAVGGYAAASAAGLLAVPLPAGAGVREVVLVVALLPVLPLPAATAVALASRAVLTAGDLLASAAATAGGVRRRGSPSR